jgi:hypothetical protein
MKKPLLRLMLGAILVVAQSAFAGHRSNPEIWFFLRGSESEAHGVDWKQGWERLFLQPDAPWPQFMSHVQVVAISPNVPDDILAKAVARLKKKHIALAMEVLAQSWVGEPVCGHNVESYTDPPGTAKIARRIKDAGGELTYITMDEPLWFGHYYDGPDACHSSIANVAERAAAIIREYRNVFPHVIVGDTEPYPALTKRPGWQDAYKQWLQAFQGSVGQSIGFMNMDVNWPEDGGNWGQSVESAASFAGVEHLPIGIIYTASIPGGAKSDEEWLMSAVQNFRRIEEQMKIVPNKALFESWDSFPKRAVTDQSGLGEDHLVKQYLLLHGISAK